MPWMNRIRAFSPRPDRPADSLTVTIDQMARQRRTKGILKLPQRRTYWRGRSGRFFGESAGCSHRRNSPLRASPSSEVPRALSFPAHRTHPRRKQRVCRRRRRRRTPGTSTVPAELYRPSRTILARQNYTGPAELYRFDVLGTRTLRSSAFRVGDLLAFTQVLETNTFEARRVKKQVFCASCVDESESLVGQFLDRAFGHFCVSRSNCLDRRRPAHDCRLVAVRRLKEVYTMTVLLRKGGGRSGATRCERLDCWWEIR